MPKTHDPHARAAAHYGAMAAQAASGTVRLQACAVRAVTPQQMRLGVTVLVDLELTNAQRFMAVAELLGTGIPEPEAYEALRGLFPAWFEAQPEPEVRESSWGEFEAAR